MPGPKPESATCGRRRRFKWLRSIRCTPVSYSRGVSSGEFQVMCPWLLHEFVDDNMKNMLIAHRGSVQNIPTIPDNVKARQDRVGISQKRILELAARSSARAGA